MTRNSFSLKHDSDNGGGVTPKVVIQSLNEIADGTNGFEIEQIVVIIKHKNSSYQVGYSAGALEQHLGLMEIGKDILKEEYYGIDLGED